MKRLLAITLLLSSMPSFAQCDEEQARKAVADEIALRQMSRKVVLEVRDSDEKYYYKRTPLSEIFETPEQLACSIRRSVVMDIAAHQSMSLIEECENKIEHWRNETESYRLAAQKMSATWSEVYAQCSKVRDKELRSKVKRYYDQRDDYQWTVDHLLNKRIEPLEAKCQEEKAFMKNVAAANERQHDCSGS